MIFSTIGLVMVLPPKPILVMSSSDGESMLKLTKEAVEDTLSKMDETLVDTKDALTKGVDVVAKPIEKSMGWFRRKPKLEEQLKIVKEKFDLGKEAMDEAIIELKDETLEKLNLATQSIKDKTIVYR
jgi:CHASE3 domain sensor protein